VPVESTGARRGYIDWARGIAVLLMIVAHTSDAWTRSADRHSAAFYRVLLLGGFAAPLFLWLAGLAVALSAARTTRRLGSRAAAVHAICRRGLEIFILAFLFRVQAFIVSPGSYPVSIFRVDILNVMGPAIVGAGLIWGLAAETGALVVLYGAAAAAIALVTPIVRAAPGIAALPLWVQWNLRPAGEFTNFTLFPWAGFVFAGAACGALLVTTSDRPAERRLQVWLAAAGALLVAIGGYTSTRPSIYRASLFWNSSPTWFAIRVGILMIGLAALFLLAEAMARVGWTWRSLERLGQRSLFVYWIHVELVYGYASLLWRGRLPLWGAMAGCAMFSVLMYGAVLLRDRVVEHWRTRPTARRAPQTATA
jgi:uncharacterized membrane protein